MKIAAIVVGKLLEIIHETCPEFDIMEILLTGTLCLNISKDNSVQHESPLT